MVGKWLLPYCNAVIGTLSCVVICTTGMFARGRSCWLQLLATFNMKQSILDSRGVVWYVVDLQATHGF